MFKFKLVGTNGETIADSFTVAVPSWRVGERVLLTPKLVYRVTAVEPGDDDVQAVLVVEPDRT